MEIKKLDFIDWKNDPITKEVFKKLKEAVEVIKESMTEGSIIGDPNGLLRLNRMKGEIDGLESVIYIDIEDDNNEEES